MYSVIRFENENNPNVLHHIGALVNQTLPGAFNGLDRSGNRFSFALSSQSIPVAHLDEALTILNRLASAISQARQWECNVTMDVAIEQDDYVNRFLTIITLTEDLINTLSSHGMKFVYSVYGMKELDGGEKGATQ